MLQRQVSSPAILENRSGKTKLAATTADAAHPTDMPPTVPTTVQTIPTEADVSRIAGVSDPSLRNLQITQCYFELSRAAGGVLGSGANWCTFATWASKQAGQTIRGEDLRQALDERLDSSPKMQILLRSLARELERLGRRREVHGIRDAIVAAIDPHAALERASSAVARGNLKVFAEIGREFARFSEAFQDGGISPDRLRAFLDGLRVGEPPDGQRLLRDAFAAYAEAGRTTNASSRAQLLFFANVLIGLHEQTRLQPEIAEAMNATLDSDVRNRILKAILPGYWLRIRIRIARMIGRPLPLDLIVDEVVAAVQDRLRLIMTQSLMTLRLPGGRTLHLGRTLDQAFPADLMQLSHPGLMALLAEIDPTPNSTLESAAVDWSDLKDRLHFIVDFFRCFHAWEPLFMAPFLPEQVSALKAGGRPTGHV